MLVVVIAGDDDEPRSGDGAATTGGAATTTGTAPAPAPGAGATTPATPAPPGAASLPARIPGVAIAPVPIGSARESLVFRTRNTILNGLRGAASGYGVQVAQATLGGEEGLLIGIAAASGASPPHIPRDVRRIVALEPVASTRMSGRPVTLYRVPGYHLAVVDGGARRAVVAIARGRRAAEDLAGAVARSIAPQ